MPPQSLPRTLGTVVVLGLSSLAASAQEGSGTALPVPVTENTAYLRLAPAADYWAFNPFVPTQMTPSASAVAAITAVLNGLNGLNHAADGAILAQQELLEVIGNETWIALTADGGGGLKFAELEAFVADALTATGNDGFSLTAFRPADDGDAAFAELHALLEANEESAGDALLLYFDQGVLTGGNNKPHVAVIGAYDLISERVLILEVDRQNHIPYWTSTAKLLEAMLHPATGEEHGRLAGETGGLLHIQPTE